MNRRKFLTRLSLTLGGAALLASYPLWIERRIVLVNTYRIPVPRLPGAFHGFRLVHLTDLHYGFLVSLEFLQSVVKRANRIPRDVTICTGDIVDVRNSSHQIDRVWPLLSHLQAPGGVFSVLGNHDHWADGDRSRFWLRRTGQDLSRKAVCFTRDGQRLWMAGTGDLMEDHVPLDSVIQSIPKDDCRIVLAHNPDTADTDYRSPVDLMISGHTHGGQVRIPFFGSPILPVRNKTYSCGVKQTPKKYPIFISRGIGWSILPIRFNCYPEIAVLELASGPA